MWTVNGKDMNVWVENENGKRICSISKSNGENDGNVARLIAAAPEMLEALKEMTKLFEQEHRDCEKWEQYTRAMQAIAKAEIR